MKISVIIPTYNEENGIRDCLKSLKKQSLKGIEIILVDDGSTDNTLRLVRNYFPGVKILLEKHQGPGMARNLGAKEATGQVLVFVDADMVFTPDFLEKLTAPIVSGKTIGTFSKEEFLLNKNNAYARCWNLNLGRKSGRMIPEDYPDVAPVFRAILKSKFDEAGGFDPKVGYTDDWTLSQKLGCQSTFAPGAVFYHRNPESLAEVWSQARWFGKNIFLTGSIFRRILNLLRYNPIVAVILAIIGVVRFREPAYFSFKIVYDMAVFTSILKSFLGEQKYK